MLKSQHGLNDGMNANFNFLPAQDLLLVWGTYRVRASTFDYYASQWKVNKPRLRKCTSTSDCDSMLDMF